MIEFGRTVGEVLAGPFWAEIEAPFLTACACGRTIRPGERHHARQDGWLQAASGLVEEPDYSVRNVLRRCLECGAEGV